MKIFTKHFRLLLFAGAFFFSFITYAQPTFTIQNTKGSCEGFSNGSFEVLVTAATGNVAVFYFGPPSAGPITATVGVPLLISGLPGAAFPGKSYLVVVQDDIGPSNVFVNIVAFPTLLTATIDSKIDNGSCVTPNGSINITASGGSGAPNYTFSWTGPSGFTATTEDISGLAGGNYNVTVFDNNTNCTETLPPITVADPSPFVFNVTTSSAINVCTGSGWILDQDGSESGVTYEVIKNNVIPTGITVTVGLGGSPISFPIPSGSFVNGDNFKVRATNGFCTPAEMNGAVVVTIVPLPVPSLSGLSPVCATTTGVVYTTDAGMSNYVWTVSPGGTITAGGNATSNTATITWNTAGPQTVSVNYTNVNGCIGAAPTTLNVTVNPLPVPTLTGPTAICVGTTGSVYTTEAGQTNYVWNVSAGGTITSGGNATSNTVTVTWGATGPQTVSVNYNDINGCSATTATVANVTVSPLPVPTITGSTVVCAGSTANVYSTEAGKTGYTWVVSAGGTVTAGGANTDNSVTITWNTASPQTVSVTYTDPSGCPAATPTISNITVNPQPAPTLGGTTLVCAATTGVLYTTEAGQSNYVWSISPGGTITSGGSSTDNTATVTWNTSGPQTITVNYSNGFGCSAATPTTLNVTVNPLPVPTLAGAITSCAGTTGIIYTTEAGQSSYIWTVSPGGTITAGGNATSNTATITWNAAGPQNVTVSYTDGNGCVPTAPTLLNVTVSPLPVPTLTGTTPVCEGSTGNIYSTDAGQSNYIWTVSPGGTITAGGTTADNTVTVTWTTAGARSVQVNYTSVSGCTAVTPTNLNITVNPQPTPTLAGVTSSCVGTTGVIYTTDAGQSNYAWIVSAGGTITSGGTPTDNTVTVTWTTAGPQTVTVNYLNASGCTAAIATVSNVTVNPLPVATLSGSATVCAGTTGVVYTTEAGQSNYAWVVSGGGTITAGGTSANNTVTVTWNTVGPQSVSVTYTDPSGCNPASPTINAVTVNPVPTPALSGTASLCAGTTGVIYSSDAGQSNYVWTVSPGGTITAGGTATDNTVTVSWITPGPQSVTINYTNASGCQAPVATSLGVTVSPLPVPTLSGTTTVCVGATGIIYTTEAGQTGYAWTVSGGGLITSGGSATDNTVTITWGTAGPQTVSVNYADVNGCSAGIPTQSNITVTALPTPTITGSTAACTGSTGNVYTTEAGQSAYLWIVSAGGTVTAGGTATDNSVTVTWTTAGPQTVSVNYTMAGGCTAAVATVSNITISNPPIPTLTGTASVCAGTTGIVYSTDAAQTNYTWTVSGGGVITAGGTLTDNTITVTWTTAGPQSVSVNYTNASGCAASTPTSLAVVVNPLPVPTLTGSAAVCIGTTGVIYTTEASQTNYIWTVSAGGTITSGGSVTDNTVTITWSATGAQSVSVNYTNASGCAAASPVSQAVTVSPLPAPTITGSTSVCAGATGNVYTTEAGQSNYTWSVSGSGTITSGGALTDNTITITWGAAGAGTVNVNYTNAASCSAIAPAVSNITINPAPTPTLAGSATVCAGTANVIYTTEAGQSSYVWTLSAGGVITSGGSATDNTVTVTWISAGAQSVSVNYSSLGCSAATATVLPVTVNALSTATLSGSNSICQGGSSDLTFTLTGVGPWNVIYTDGTSNFPVAFATSPATVSVTPLATTTYSLVSVSNAQCGAGTTSGTAIVTVNPIPGDQVTFGIDTWIGYAYTDAASPAPPVSNIDYASAKYRGFMNEAEMTSMGFSTYNSATDAFNFDLSNNVPLAGANICGSFLNDYSLRMKMTKTFAAGIYTFTLGADDGVRFFIDGVLVDLNNPSTFGTHAYFTYTSVAQCITAGTHDLVIEYFERGGFSRLSFDYQLANAPTVSTPVTLCIGSTAPTLTASSLDPGVTGFNWYTDAALTNLVSTGANYTPLAADLDMSVAASSDFFVTAIYACGEGQSAQVVVNIVNGATVTLPTPPVQICQTGGVVDLSTLVSALPAGGTFVFSGTGVTTSPSFDPTLVTGSSTITVDYSVGGCTAPQQTFAINVINTATITVPATAVAICQSSGIQDLTLLVSATPVSGTFTFTGAGVTGTSFDPSTQSGIVPIQVDYNVGGPGGCSDSKTFNFNVTTNAILTVNNATIVCPNAADVDLRTLVSAVPAGGVFTFTGTGVTGNFFDPTSSAGSTVSISIAYNQGGCTALSTVQIVVRSAVDPACTGGGGGTNCFAFATSDPVIETRPTCANQNDGQLIFGVKGGTGTYVITLYDSISTPIFTQAKVGSSATPITFNSLSPSLTYFYKIDDGTNTCTLPYSLPVQTTVTASATSFVDATCFGQATGTAVINASGSQTGQYFYSVDNGVNWIVFTPGNVVNDLPPNGTYNILVGESSTDACAATVSVTINNANPDLQIGTTITDATCSNNDGRIVITPPVAPLVGGGGPYLYALSDGATTTAFQASTTFDDLAGGVYSILVQDGINCVKTITPVNVTFPGFVNSNITFTNADCNNNGLSGSINVDITDIGGVYKVALSTDQFNEPAAADYIDYSEPSITFDNIARGTYFIYLQSQAAACPTRSAAINIGGTYAVNFIAAPICENNQISILISNITGEPNVPFTINVYDKTNPGSPVQTINQSSIPVTGSLRLDYNDYSFLQIPDKEYQIQIDQTSPTTFCQVFSPLVDFVTNRPLFARAKPRPTAEFGESYPDQFTGQMSIIDFDGGLIPYQIRIEMDSASVGGQSFETDFEEVQKNNNLQYQKDYVNIPAGRYIVQVSDEFGCVLEFYERVPLDIDLYIPNIFTPNADALNDVFFIRNLPVNEGNLTISDRWGAQVFSTSSYQNDWNGDGLADGVYFYTLKTPTETKKGWVEILRGTKP